MSFSISILLAEFYKNSNNITSHLYFITSALWTFIANKKRNLLELIQMKPSYNLTRKFNPTRHQMLYYFIVFSYFRYLFEKRNGLSYIYITLYNHRRKFDPTRPFRVKPKMGTIILNIYFYIFFGNN